MIEIMQEKAVYLDEDGESSVNSALEQTIPKLAPGRKITPTKVSDARVPWTSASSYAVICCMCCRRD